MVGDEHRGGVGLAREGTGRGGIASTRRARALVVVAAVLVAGCGAVDPVEEAGAPAAADPRDPVGATPTTRLHWPVDTSPDIVDAPATTAPRRPITIAVAGDTYAQGVGSDVVSGMGARLGPMSEVLGRADLAFLNLETAITHRGTAEPKAFTFRTGPEVLDGIALAGVDAVSMANNHGVDFGPEGLVDSLAARDAAPIPVVGIGRDAADAFSPAVFDVDGTSVALIGVSHVLDSSLQAAWTASDSQPGMASAYERERFLAAVAAAVDAHDVVVVFLHWGTEGETCPTTRQLEMSDDLTAVGATAVVGGHAHRLIGGGYKGSTYVHYGLGNFGFGENSAAGARTGVLTMTIDGGRVVADEWTPGRISGGVPHPLVGEEAVAEERAWRDQISCTDLSPVPVP